MHSGVPAALSLAYRCGGSAGIASEVSAGPRLPVSALGQTALKSPDANALVLIASRSVAQSSLMTGGIHKTPMLLRGRPDADVHPPCRPANRRTGRACDTPPRSTAGKPLSRWARRRRLPICAVRWQRLDAVHHGNEQ